MGSMVIRSSIYVVAGAVFLSAVASSGAAEENCLFQLTAPKAPYYVLGTRVTPQSNYLVTDDCEKTTEEVRDEMLSSEVKREPPSSHAVELHRQARLQGDALIRRRDEAAKAGGKRRIATGLPWLAVG